MILSELKVGDKFTPKRREGDANAPVFEVLAFEGEVVKVKNLARDREVERPATLEVVKK